MHQQRLKTWTHKTHLELLVSFQLVCWYKVSYQCCLVITLWLSMGWNNIPCIYLFSINIAMNLITSDPVVNIANIAVVKVVHPINVLTITVNSTWPPDQSLLWLILITNFFMSLILKFANIKYFLKRSPINISTYWASTTPPLDMACEVLFY